MTTVRVPAAILFATLMLLGAALNAEDKPAPTPAPAAADALACSPPVALFEGASQKIVHCAGVGLDCAVFLGGNEIACTAEKAAKADPCVCAAPASPEPGTSKKVIPCTCGVQTCAVFIPANELSCVRK